MKYSIKLFIALFSLATISSAAFALPSCHPGIQGRCNENATNVGFAWYRTASNTVFCFADDAPEGSSPSDQRNCSPDGFGFFLAADGYNRCYSVDGPVGTAYVSDELCQ